MNSILCGFYFRAYMPLNNIMVFYGRKEKNIKGGVVHQWGESTEEWKLGVMGGRVGV